MSEADLLPVPPFADETVVSLIGERLTLQAFHQLAGVLAGYPFVKVVVDRQENVIHFINNAKYQFHLDYIGEQILKTNVRELEGKIDEFNRSVYFDPQRRFCLGIAALHSKKEDPFFTLETVEVDTMDAAMLKFFYDFVKKNLDPGLPLLFKPANHLQEEFIAEIDAAEIPRIYSHEIFASAKFIALNKGKTSGRLRAFRNAEEYRRQFSTIEWHDILVMARVPDDIPRVAGIINTAHTTPLSHTNVLAGGWQIPNAIQLGIEEKIEKEHLDGQWVRYEVDSNAGGIVLEKAETPPDPGARPVWYAERVKMDQPETVRTPIQHLKDLRLTDRFRYGTKAANLGELNRLLKKGSSRLLGFYQISRPPRENLLPYLAAHLKMPPDSDLEKAAWEFLRSGINIPRGIAIPFSIQQEFLQGSPQIQQQIGKLKMALELRSKAVEPLCLALQQMIISARLPNKLRDYVDSQIVKHLGGVSSFVVRSSSNAEDLENFSAAGIYESINHVATSEKIFDSLRTVWASLVSPRSIRLRDEAGISLDDSYMGVIIQEEVSADMGGVMITKNPANSGDFRNIYINVSTKSVVSVVQGSDMPYQFLYNTVEGGGRTVSLGSAKEDLCAPKKAVLARLALAGRLLQSHFSQDYTFSNPLDIEWAAKGDTLHILQARPYAR